MTDPMQSKDTSAAQPLRTLPFTPNVANTIRMLTGEINDLALPPAEQSTNLVFVPVMLVYNLEDAEFVKIIPRTPCEHDSEIVAAHQNPQKRIRTRKKGGMSGC